jgi:peptide methionine sulfoxide reductase msrA/msrB
MSYTTAIFYHNDEQRLLAEKTRQELAGSDLFTKSIVTKILPFTTFYPAEDYHQDFYMKSAQRYQQYKIASGRDKFKDFVWQQIEAGKK